MGIVEKQNKKIAEATRPYLEPGEEIKAAYIGQTRIPPITYLLIGPLVFIFIIRFMTVVATDRNVHVFTHKFMRQYKYEDGPRKVPLASANVETGSMWVSVDGGPKLWVMPFGPVKRRLNELAAYMASVRSAPSSGEGAAGSQS